MEYTDEAIPLLSYDSSSFTLNERGLSLLRSLSAPISILGVAGMYRTGKSYLLNRVLLGRSEGFGVGPTVNPCTKGLWLWGRPLEGQTSEGEKCSVLIMDSEGIGALDEDADHDTRIFALVVLISSVFLYNSVGAIDETALQNLSLVVNLTKHIQVRSGNEEMDSQDYAVYFPSFYWILRDFSLQLVDSEGEQLTPKEYLERALDLQKGFSDIIEEKNRVRRLLKDFFPERDCCTLVRPVTEEGDLQNLASKPENELRTEFVEQVKLLRTRLFQRAKLKTIHGKPLNGEMIANLVQSYVESINQGAAPSIENTWAYICKNECGNALKNALAFYDTTVVQETESFMPIEPSTLQETHKSGKSQAVQLFHSTAVGEDKETYLQKLLAGLSEKHAMLKATNENRMQEAAAVFLSENYAIIDSKIRKGELKVFLDFEKEMRSFYHFFLEHGPTGPNKREIILEFVQAKVAGIADHYIKDAVNELELREELHTQKVQAMQTEMKELKDEFQKEKSVLSTTSSTLESERAQTQAIHSELRSQIQTLQGEVATLKNNFKTERKALESQLETAEKRTEDLEQQTRAADRNLYQKEADYSQERELTDKKIKYLEASLEESRTREKEYLNDLKTMKQEHLASVKEMLARHELQVKTYQSNLEQEVEHSHDTERELEKMENTFERARGDWEESQLKAEVTISELTWQLENTRKTLNAKEEEFKAKIKADKQEKDEALGTLRTRVTGLEQHLKDKEQNIKSLELGIQKETAMLTQKIEFLNQHAEELQSQLESERTQHSSLFKTLQQPADLKLSTAQLEKLRQQHAEELRQLEQTSEETARSLTNRLEAASQRCSELETQLQVETEQHAVMTSSLKSEAEHARSERTKLIEELNNLRSQTTQSESDQKQLNRIRSLETQLQEAAERHQEELIEASQKASEALQQLKDFYEEEKQRLERRAQEDKERAERRHKAICEDYEDRLRSEAEGFEDELAGKEEELRELQEYYQLEHSQLQHQAALSQQKLESLEKHLHDTQQQLEAQAALHRQAMEQQQQWLDAEKALVAEKREALQAELAAKDRELTGVLEQNAQLQKQSVLDTSELEDLKSGYQAEKDLLLQRYEAIKDSYQKLSDEFSAKRSDFKRELALATQELEFKNQRLSALEFALQEQEDKHGEALRTQKTEAATELTNAVQKLTRANEELESKLEQRRRQGKEDHAAIGRQLSAIEKERAVLLEKLQNLETKSEDTENRLRQEVDNLQLQLREKTEAENSDRLSVQLENERLKTLLQEMEKEGGEKNAAYERERVLWENKFNFLVQQRDQARSDQAEAQRKFDSTLEHINKRGASDKEKLENTTASLLKSIEKRHALQLQETKDAYEAMLETANEKVRTLEETMKQIHTQVEVDKNKRHSSSYSLNKRICELEESEKAANKELETVKKERDLRVEEIRTACEREVSDFKAKIAEAERRAKEAEQNKAQLFLQHEKDKAKWNLERDQLTSSKSELADALERSEKRKEVLLKESEKLRIRKTLAKRKESARNAESTKRDDL